MMAVLELVEAIVRIGEAFAGFRFIASSSYRAKTRARWASTSKIQILIECGGVVIGIAFVILLLYVLFHLGVINDARLD
jgi:hypothetical protein